MPWRKAPSPWWLDKAGCRRWCPWPAVIWVMTISIAVEAGAADLIVQGSEQTTISADTLVSGDVIVRESGRLTVNGAVLTVDGDVWIEDSGLMVLEGFSTLVLSLEFDEEHHVDISGNAELRVVNSEVRSTGGQFWFELFDDAGGIPTLEVSGGDSWLTNHSGIRPFNRARVIVSGGDVEELQARDNVQVTVSNAATYPVYFFDGVAADLSGLYTDTDYTISNTVSVPGGWSFQITDSWVEGYQIDLKNGADVTLDDSDGIVLSIHTPGDLGDELQVVEGLTADTRASGSTSNLGSSFSFTDSNVALINVYVFGTDRVLLRDMHVNEVNAEQGAELIIGQKGYTTTLNCNLCQVYDHASFKVVQATIDASQNLPSATSSYADFDDMGRGWMRFADMDLSELDLTAREQGTLELVNCTGAVVEQEDPTATVIEIAFDAEFTASDLSGGVPLTVDFFDLSGGAITAHAWTFGDGGESRVQAPSYQYIKPGEYTVGLEVSRAGGNDSETKLNYIVVSETLRPHVRTEPASEVGETSATLNGSVNPNGSLAAAAFDWGDSEAYDATRPAGSVGPGNLPIPISTDLTGLFCGRRYHFRARAVNSSGTAAGGDRSFRTRTCEVLELSDLRISQPETYEACRTIRAGPNVRIEGAGSCVLHSGGTVELGNGVSVASGGELTVEILRPPDCDPL